MRRRFQIIAYLMALVLLTIACKPSVPEQYIQPGEMEDILYDYHLSQSMASRNGTTDNDYKRQLYFETVLRNHGVTRADFDSSLVYYYTRADYFLEIYKHVQDRLGDQAIELGASSGEIERYTSQSLNGDTADVWEGSRQYMLLSNRPYNQMQFYQKADTSYHAGDSFLLTFQSSFLSMMGNRPMIALLSVTYDNDSTLTQQMTVSTSNGTTLRIPACNNERPKEIKGFFLMGKNQRDDNEKGLSMLYLSHIQLIRFHKTVQSPLPEKPASDSLSAEKPDSTITDSVQKPRIHRLGERPQVDVRPNLLDKKPVLEKKPITR